MSRRFQLVVMVMVLVIAAALRIPELSRLPPGLNDEEISNIAVAELVRGGVISSFYSVGDPMGSREGLYPTLEALSISIMGYGTLPIWLLSVWCGLISIALMFALMRRLINPYAGLVAAITMAVSFWPVLLSRSALREALLLPLALGALYAFTVALHLRQTVRPHPPQTFPYAAFGVLVAVMAYAHWTGLIYIPFLVTYFIWLIRTRQPLSRRVFGHIRFSLLMLLIVGLPYLAFTLRASDLSGIHPFITQRPENILTFIGTIIQTAASIGIVGDPLATQNIPNYPLIGAAASFLLLVGLIDAVQRRHAPNKMLLLMAFGFGLFADAWSRGATNFRHLTIALPGIIGLIASGAVILTDYVRDILGSLTRGRKFILNAVQILVTVGLTASSTYFVAHDLFEVWQVRPDVQTAYRARLGNLAAYLDRTQDDLSTSICTFELGTGGVKLGNSSEGVNIASLVPDSVLINFMLNRKIDLRYANCLTGMVLTQGGKTQRFAFADPNARNKMAPQFKDWLVGSQPEPAPGLPLGTVLRVNAQPAIADSFGRALMSYAEFETPMQGRPLKADLPLRMGGYLTFEGYRLDPPGPYKPGQIVNLVTYWRADGQQVPGLRLFAHITRSKNVEPILQNDVLDVDSTLLEDRDVFIQIITLPIPPGFPPDEYFLSIGAYSTVTKARLPLYDGTEERGNRLFLDKITVASK